MGNNRVAWALNRALSGREYAAAAAVVFALQSYLGVDHSSLLTAVLMVVVLLMLATFSVTLFSLVVFTGALLSTMYIHTLMHWGRISLTARMEVALESPGYEMLEYLQTYLDYRDYGLLLVLALLAWLLYKAIRCHRRESLQIRIGALAATTIAVTTLVITDTGRDFAAVHASMRALELRERLTAMNERLAYIKSTPSSNDCNEMFDTVVIVIGETATRQRMGLYGYERDTTPFLDSLNPVVMQGISPANTTRLSLMMMLSEVSAENIDDFATTESLVTTLRSCGYTTYWLSKQGKRGFANAIGSSIALEADESLFLTQLSHHFASGYDTDVLPELERIVARPDERQAIFIHLLGSHNRYEMRYPQDFAMFGNHGYNDTYDNSIYFSDHVKKEIFARLPKEKLLFSYISDHGELLTDNLFGHGTHIGYRDEFEIPMIFWSDQTEALTELELLTVGKTVNGASFTNIMRYLVGIDSQPGDWFNGHVAVSSPDNLRKVSDLVPHAKDSTTDTPNDPLLTTK